LISPFQASRLNSPDRQVSSYHSSVVKVLVSEGQILPILFAPVKVCR